MNITYTQQTDTLRIEFLDQPPLPTKHETIIFHRTTKGQLAAIEVPNASANIPIEAFMNIQFDLPTGLKEGIIEYEEK